MPPQDIFSFPVFVKACPAWTSILQYAESKQGVLPLSDHKTCPHLLRGPTLGNVHQIFKAEGITHSSIPDPPPLSTASQILSWQNHAPASRIPDLHLHLYWRWRQAALLKLNSPWSIIPKGDRETCIVSERNTYVKGKGALLMGILLHQHLR